MDKVELKNFLIDNVNGRGDIDRDVVIVTGKRQRCITFNVLPFGKSKTKIGYYDEGFNIFSNTQKIDDLDGFIDMLDGEYNILYIMSIIDKTPHYYNNAKGLESIMIINEAAKMWGVTESNIRYHIKDGKLVNGIEYRKAGRITLITKRAMVKLFGDMPKGEEIRE